MAAELEGIGTTAENLTAAAEGETTSGPTCTTAAKTAGGSFPGWPKFRQVGAAIDHEERYRALLHNVETAQVFEKERGQGVGMPHCGHIVVGTQPPTFAHVAIRKPTLGIAAENFRVTASLR